MAKEAKYQVGDVIANKYVIESILDPSTNSQSFLGNENYSQEKVCIKIYYNQISEDYLKSPNFFLQANTVTTVVHDNISRVYDINEDMGRVFLIREFIQGRSFDEWISSEKANPRFLERGIEILWQACQGLQKMHETGKHLNIHPNNLIVGDVTSKLADWDPRGMTTMDFSQHLPSLSLFTCYRAPEIRSDGNAAYPSSDLYSMGALLYRLLFSKHPPEGYQEILTSLNSPQTAINEFLSKALHIEPEKRFQMAEDFANQLWDLSSMLAQSPPAKAEESTPIAPSQPPPEPDASFADSSASFTSDSSVSASFTPEAAAPIQDPPPQEQVYTNPVEESSPESFSSLETPLSQPTLFEGGGGSSQQSFAEEPFQSELEKPEPSYPASSEFRPGTDSSRKFSLEEQDFGGGGSATMEGSYSMFGFKGLQQNQTGIEGPPKPKQKNPKLKFFIILAIFAVVFVILVALVIRKMASEEGQDAIAEAPAPVVESDLIIEEPPEEAVPEEPEASEAEAVEPAPEVEQPEPEAKREEPQPAEETSSSPQPRILKPTVSAPEPAEKTSRANSKVSAEREKEIMGMYEKEQWPETPDACLKMGDDMNDLGRTFEANLIYQHVLNYEGVTEKQKINAYGALAVTYKELGKLKEARSSVKSLLEIDPGNRFGRNFLRELGK